jgi:hypothetical protein
VDPESPATPGEEVVARMIFKGELKLHIKRKSILDDNIQKACSLVIRQCADLLQTKLKQQAQWSTVTSSQAQDAVGLISLIKTVTFRFEDQEFLRLALCQSKTNLCNLGQSNMSNHEHPQRFQNPVDVATACNGQMHDQAIVDIAAK